MPTRSRSSDLDREEAQHEQAAYGQALAMNQENAVTNARQTAINELAMNLVGQDRDWAATLMNAQQSGLSTAASLVVGMIDSLTSQAAASNNYALQVASLQLQQEMNAIEAMYKRGQLDQMQRENAILDLQAEALKLQNEMTVSGRSGSGGSIFIDGYTGPQDGNGQATEKSQGYDNVVRITAGLKKAGDTQAEIEEYLRTRILQGTITATEAQEILNQYY